MRNLHPPPRAACWACAAGVFFGNFFLHKPLSDVSDWRLAQVGFGVFNRQMLLSIGGASALAALLLALRLRRRLLAWPLIVVLAVLTLLTVGAQRSMLVSNVELIHFPQYALLAALLLGGGAGWQTAWLGSVAAGVADEVYQQLVIYAGRPDTYLDYNDMILNAIGAAWAVLLLALVRSPGGSTAVKPLPWQATGTVLLGLVAFTFWWDPPATAPFWRFAATGRVYHVLSLSEAVVAFLALHGMLWVVNKPQGRPF